MLPAGLIAISIYAHISIKKTNDVWTNSTQTWNTTCDETLKTLFGEQEKKVENKLEGYMTTVVEKLEKLETLLNEIMKFLKKKEEDV